MLRIEIPEREYFDERTERFGTIKATTLYLEHSLISISKWEAKWHLPFFDSEKTNEQTLDYIRCMILNREIDEKSYYANLLTADDIKKINDYINDPMTATVITDDGRRGRNQKVTSELIYCWMIQFNIPAEFEKWHINRLIMLIRVCGEENKPKKKMSRKEIMAQNKALNAARKARLNTRG